MHENHAVNHIIEQIESMADEKSARKVVGVSVKLGALSHVTPEHFREHFELLSKGTVADGAKLNLDVSTDINDPHAHEVILESIDVFED